MGKELKSEVHIRHLIYEFESCRSLVCVCVCRLCIGAFCTERISLHFLGSECVSKETTSVRINQHTGILIDCTCTQTYLSKEPC